jgi:hypothetical protein
MLSVMQHITLCQLPGWLVAHHGMTYMLCGCLSRLQASAPLNPASCSSSGVTTGGLLLTVLQTALATPWTCSPPTGTAAARPLMACVTPLPARQALSCGALCRPAARLAAGASSAAPAAPGVSAALFAQWPVTPFVAAILSTVRCCVSAATTTHCCLLLLPQLALGCQLWQVRACHGPTATPQRQSHTTQPARAPAPAATSATQQEGAQLHLPMSVHNAALGSGWPVGLVQRLRQVRAAAGNWRCYVRCDASVHAVKHLGGMLGRAPCCMLIPLLLLAVQRCHAATHPTERQASPGPAVMQQRAAAATAWAAACKALVHCWQLVSTGATALQDHACLAVSEAGLLLNTE